MTQAALLDELRTRVRQLEGRPEVTSIATHPALSGLLQLHAGGTYAVGSTSLAMLLMAGPSSDGAWCAVVGSDRFGLEAARMFGVNLDRTIMVPDPGEDPVTVVAALIDVVHVVVTCGLRIGEHDGSRLKARLHRRQAIVVSVGDWPRAEARLRLRDIEWSGLGVGHGHLQARQVTVEVQAAGRPADSRRLWLPDARQHVRLVEQPGLRSVS